MWCGITRFLGLFLLAAACVAGRAEDFGLESVGVRGGGSFTSAAHNFHEAEGFLNWNLPLEADLDSRWWLQMQLQTSVGWLGDPGGNAFLWSAGPGLLLGRDRFPLIFDVGISPTVLSRYAFQTKDFGSLFQFTTHAGFNFNLGAHACIGYRFQHMSNAGFVHPNPGLNLHFLAVSYRF